MRDSQGQITRQLMPEAESAGDRAGQAAGSRFSAGLGKAAAIGGVVAAGGIVAGFKGLYEVGAVFDDVADTIRVGTGASGDALDALVKSAQNVGTSVPADFAVVGTTVADLNTRLGLTGPVLEKVASQYLEAGRMLGTDIDVGKTSAAFSAFRIEGDAVAGAMDTLFQVSQATGVGMNELADAVQKNAPAMQTLGFSFAETAALAGSLDKAGLNSTAMLSSMSKGMVNLAKAGEEPEAAFKRVTGEIQGFVDSGDKAAAINLAGKVFGTKGASQFVGALESGAIAMDDLVAGAALTGDTILGVGAETQDFAEKWDLVKNKATLALEPFASAVFTGLGDSLTAMMPGLEAFGSWLGDNTWVLGVLAGLIGVTLVGAFIAWAASVWVATIALLANPVTWIVLGIIALIAALVLLIANWDSVVSWATEVWGGFVNWAGSAFAGLGSWLTEVWQGFSSWFMGALSGFGAWVSSTWSGLWNWVGSILSGFGSWLSGLWSGIVSTAQGFWNGLVGFVSGIPGRIIAGLSFLASLPGIVGGWIAGMVSAAIGHFGNLLGFVAGIPGQVLGALGNVGSILIGAGSAIIQGFLSGLQSAFEGVKSFVGGIADWIAANKGPKAYDMALLKPAGGWIMGGFTESLRSHIPELKALMADVTDTISVGAPSSLAVASSVSGQALSGMPAGAGGRELNITVNNPVPEPAGRSIANVLAKVAYLGLEGAD